MQLSNGKTIRKKQESSADMLPLNENWELSFEENKGAPANVHFDKLMPWNEHSEFGIKYFSGTATYSKSIQLDKSQLNNKRIVLDLGQVKNSAAISVNGKLVKLMWYPPFKVDITDFCQKGENVLEVEVTNLWLNRIIGDKYLPEDCKWGPMREFTYVTPNLKIGRNLLEIPEWVKNNTERPNKERVTFCVLDFFEKEKPLLPSGLIGPAQITIEEVVMLKN